jgi:hypothetical protein
MNGYYNQNLCQKVKIAMPEKYGIWIGYYKTRNGYMSC